MSGRLPQVPAADQVLAVLTLLGSQVTPTPAVRIARELGLPRSTTYHLLRSLIDSGFVVHLPEERRYGLGLAAYALGTGYLRQAPLQRLARQPLASLVDRTGHAAHLAVLHGREVAYLIEERAPGRPPLVTDVGVRLPAQLTASGRAILAVLPLAALRAIFPTPETFVRRNQVGPTTLTALRRQLAAERARGFAQEDGEVTAGFGSVAIPVLDHAGHPVAGVAVTYPLDETPELPALVSEVRRSVRAISRRVGT